MDIIGSQKIWSFVEGQDGTVSAKCPAIRKAAAVLVKDFMDLATKVAELQYQNRDYVLLFRGQNGDHRNRSKYTSLRPSIMRATNSIMVPTATTLEKRFQRLREAEALLVKHYDDEELVGRDRLRRQQILRWSILQHYEVCRTPLLDVTHSLRIAASFASENARDEAFVFILGVPHISGAITASAEAGIQIVRLSSVCPPTALRPHIQEGYLLGEYPDVSGVDQKAHYSFAEMDFGRRLIAKFRFRPSSFWEKSGYFPRIPHEALYPRSAKDPLKRLAEAVAAALPSE
jgi:hypothetical protein